MSHAPLPASPRRLWALDHGPRRPAARRRLARRARRRSSGFGGGGGGAEGAAAASRAAAAAGAGSGGSPLILIVVFAFAALFVLFGLFKAAQLRKRRRQRVARVELASAEAAGDDAYFAADSVKAEAAALHRAIVAAWTGATATRSLAMLGPDLLTEWVRRLDDFERKGWHNDCELAQRARRSSTSASSTARTTTTTASSCASRRCCATSSSTPPAACSSATRRTTSSPRSPSTGRSAAPSERWMLLSIEQDSEGAHHLDAPIVASPWSRRGAAARRRRHRARGRRRRARTRRSARSSTSTTRATRASQAMDLSVVDGRFAPAVLEAAARRAVEAWAEAVDGADAALERAATPEAAHALLYPDGTSTRLVVRGPRLQALRIAALDAHAQPPTMAVEAELRGRRYLEDRDTAAVLEGSKDRETAFTERWTLALGADPATPWRIVATAAVG